MSDTLACPNNGCGSRKLTVEVTGTGTLNLDFGRDEGREVLQTNVNFLWTPESQCRCLECGWEGTAQAAMQDDAMSVLRTLLNFLKALPLDQTSDAENLNAKRARLIVETEKFCKKHTERLSGDWG
jgi:hypothetical protein